jgi:hypothetical protein
MHRARFLLPILVALAAAGCARQQQAYVIDPSTGQPVAVVMQQQTAQPVYAQQSYQPPAPQAAASGERGLFNSWPSAPQPQYAQQTYQQPAPDSGRGLFAASQSAPPVYVQQPAFTQNGVPQYPTPRTGRPYGAAPNGFASASLY